MPVSFLHNLISKRVNIISLTKSTTIRIMSIIKKLHLDAEKNTSPWWNIVNLIDTLQFFSEENRFIWRLNLRVYSNQGG